MHSKEQEMREYGGAQGGIDRIAASLVSLSFEYVYTRRGSALILEFHGCVRTRSLLAILGTTGEYILRVIETLLQTRRPDEGCRTRHDSFTLAALRAWYHT